LKPWKRQSVSFGRGEATEDIPCGFSLKAKKYLRKSVFSLPAGRQVLVLFSLDEQRK